MVHDYDGSWKFLTGDVAADEARVICLEDIVQKDKTLNDLFNLGYGEIATRKAIGEKWVRSIIGGWVVEN